MRILHAIRTFSPETGGPVEGLKRIVQTTLSENVYDAEIVCLDDPEAPFLQSESLPLHALGPARGTYGYTRGLDRWLKANLGRFDGVVIHGLWQYHSLALWRACRGRVPYLLFTHGMLDPWFKRAYPLKHLKKMLYWHSIERKVLRDAKRVMFTASLEAELARKTFPRSRWMSAVVPYGTLSPRGDRAGQVAQFYGICPQVAGRSFVLFLGRLHEKKGCDLLIEAFAKYAPEHPVTDLVIAGPDEHDQRAKLAATAEALGIGDRVHFPGMLRGDVKWGAFYAAEVFALPSHQENFGIAVAEALACGTPVLISNKVNIWPEIVEDAVGLVGDDTLDGTNRLLDRWGRLSVEERAAMAAKCRDSFERRFDVRRTPRAVASLFAK